MNKQQRKVYEEACRALLPILLAEHEAFMRHVVAQLFREGSLPFDKATRRLADEYFSGWREDYNG